MFFINIYFKTICQKVPDKIGLLINKEYNSLNSITKKMFLSQKKKQYRKIRKN